MPYFRQILIVIFLVLTITACTGTTSPDDTSLVQETTSRIEITESASIDTPATAGTRGQALFVQMLPEVGFACATCHHLTESRLIGPGLGNLASRLESYEIDLSLEEYILESITQPQAYIVEDTPEYPDSIMPANYSEFFTEDQLNDLTTYILSL